MCGLKVFDYLKLVRCPRSLAPTLVTLPSMSFIPFTPFSGDDVWIFSAFQRFSFLETDFVFEPRKA